MDWGIVELNNQSIFLTKYGRYVITIAIPILEYKSDLNIRHIPMNGEVLFELDKWYFNGKDKKYYSGIGNKNER